MIQSVCCTNKLVKVICSHVFHSPNLRKKKKSYESLLVRCKGIANLRYIFLINKKLTTLQSDLTFGYL